MNVLRVSIFILSAFGLSVNVYAASLEQLALTEHNKWRALHHAGNLVWDNQLAAYAEHYANLCQFQHSHTSYGENLAKGYPSVTAAIDGWYAEDRLYSYRHPGFSMQTGHFTQLVWKSTKKLGCGLADCYDRNGKSWQYLVCEYSPHGNVLSKTYFMANVQ